MTAKRPLTGPFSIKLSTYVGRHDFLGAIRYLNEYLAKYPDDVGGWTFLAQCHAWAGSRSLAIDASLAALRVSPNEFDALRMLSEMYAEANECDQAVAFIRRALEHFPRPTTGISPRAVRAFRVIAPVLPKRLRASIEADLRKLQDPNDGNRRWYAWAKEYLRWYDQQMGGNSAPVLH